MTLSSLQPFVRNRITWLAYGMLAYIGFTQAILGPLMPFLRSELALNYTQGGLLPAAIAIGLIFSGLFGGWLARHVGRRALFWGGGAALASGIVILGLSREFGLVFVSILTMGLGGSLAQIMVLAILSDEHGEQRAIALTEANVAASFSGTLTPLVIGGFQQAGIDWRAIAVVAVFLLGPFFMVFRHQAIPDIAHAQRKITGQSGGLPLSFWLYWLALFFMVAFEMALSVWTTDFFAGVVGFTRANAALIFGVFPASMLTGRLIGSRLMRRWASMPLLVGSLGLTLIGFPLLWLARTPALNILGLFITGLGIANQFPLTMSIAVGLAQEKTNQASARISLAVGSALLLAPLALGWLADLFGLQGAFGMALVLLISAILVIFINNRFLPVKNISTTS